MIKEIFRENELEITDHQEKQLQRYYELLIEWNKKINLTAITEYKEVIYKHFLDSAFILKSELFQKKESASVLDLGTGAGFPGIVLAVLCPQYSFTLVDSLMKRIEFLHIIKEELELDHITLYHGRAEDLGRQKEFRNQFDYVVSRAVAELPVLLEYCIPFVRKEGYFISYKGKKYQEEINNSNTALQMLGADIKKIEMFQLMNEDRFLIFVENSSLTDDKFPRRAGKIKKNPLC